jgi:hypothetical protein
MDKIAGATAAYFLGYWIFYPIALKVAHEILHFVTSTLIATELVT